MVCVHPVSGRTPCPVPGTAAHRSCTALSHGCRPSASAEEGGPVSVPGMNSGINANDPTVVAAFRTALAHQGLIALLIFILLAVGWATIKAWLPASQVQPAAPAAAARAAEAAARRLLRTGFGILWLFDGLLQAQPAMAVGLPSKVIEPTAASSPTWVQHLVNWAGTSWSYHPDPGWGLGGWIQVGIGIWLSWRQAAGGPAPPGWPAWAGDWWSGSSVSHSGDFRPRADLAVRCPWRGAAL